MKHSKYLVLIGLLLTSNAFAQNLNGFSTGTKPQESGYRLSDYTQPESASIKEVKWAKIKLPTGKSAYVYKQFDVPNAQITQLFDFKFLVTPKNSIVNSLKLDAAADQSLLDQKDEKKNFIKIVTNVKAEHDSTVYFYIDGNLKVTHIYLQNYNYLKSVEAYFSKYKQNSAFGQIVYDLVKSIEATIPANDKLL